MKEQVYQTKKRNEILKFIENNKDKHINAIDISNYLESLGERVNKSTIYRYLKVLVDEGKIRKYVIDEKEGACYQSEHESALCKHILHLKCTICNEVFHIDADDYEILVNTINNKTGFIVDNTKTVLYGKCKRCAKGILA